MPAIVSSASLTPSIPRIGAISRFSNGLPSSNSYTVRIAASITPPVAPKITPAPVASPNGESNSSSGSSLNWIPASLIMRASSLVVNDASISCAPDDECSGLCASNFLEVQGIIATE